MLKTDANQLPRNDALKVNRPEIRYGSALDIRDSTKTIVRVMVGLEYKQMYDGKRLDRLVKEMTKYTLSKLMSPSMKSIARTVVDIPILLTNSLEWNNQLKEGATTSKSRHGPWGVSASWPRPAGGFSSTLARGLA